MGYNFVEIFKDWAYENWGYWEAGIQILPDRAGERDCIFFTIETSRGIGEAGGYREDRNSACSSFTVETVRNALEKEWKPEKDYSYITVGDSKVYEGDYVAFRVEDGTITRMVVKKLSVDLEVDAKALFEKIKDCKNA